MGSERSQQQQQQPTCVWLAVLPVPLNVSACVTSSLVRHRLRCSHCLAPAAGLRVFSPLSAFYSSVGRLLSKQTGVRFGLTGGKCQICSAVSFCLISLFVQR